MGASITLEATPYIIKKGGALIRHQDSCRFDLRRDTLGIYLGEQPVGSGILFKGLSTLAVVAALNDTNGGLYMALMGQYGKPADVGAYTIMSLESGPFLTMLTLGVWQDYPRLPLADLGRGNPASWPLVC